MYTMKYPESCIVKNPDIIVKIFELSRFCETEDSRVLKLASDIPLAWTLSFWTCCLVVTMLASCNPRILALVVWDSMPVIRTLLELCISQHYSFPPPNYTSRSEPSSERLLRLGMMAELKDRDCVLAWEKEALIVQGLWGEDRGNNPLEPNQSEYVGWLMRLDFGPTQPARAPPMEIMQQLRGMNERFSLGMKLASSRDPDYLGRMVGSDDDAAWVDQLLRDVPEILNALPAATLCARYCRSVLSQKVTPGDSAASTTDSGIVDTSIKKKLVGYLESVMELSSTSAALYSSQTQDPSSRFQEARDIFEYFLVRLCPLASASSSTDMETVVYETKVAMGALFHGALQWPNVLLQTIQKTPGTGFFDKALQWIEDIVKVENDVKWIVSSIQFLLKLCTGADIDNSLEQSLLTIARLLTGRLFIFDWLVHEHDALIKSIAKKVDEHLSKSDSVMEDVAGKKADYAVWRTTARAKVEVKMSDGTLLNIYPEILRLALLILSVGDVNKQAGSTWSSLFGDTSDAQHMPKRLADGQALLSCDPSMPNDIQFRLRLVQFSREAEVVRVAMDGLSLIQTIDIARNTYGVNVKMAQIIHGALLMALEQERERSVPVHLEQESLKRLLLLIKYYADHGGEFSQRALEFIRSRFALDPSITSISAPRPLKETNIRLPDFFQLAL
ncbi:hypothetical protein BCR41DRAFT_193695 [Lobosporangium transversale]|uniref:Uncharacterized protein n=1 Tax=Lobosporangium transversale TaxID=64571 RepID=A0A1Y2G980_9FUNG|nr:hypothetical protein BCR41DRAFT_193695 [Lobosporangium transversale]ORZ04684.1 hypothetical protein BCR41DRAFT_193695 [Lobosporangium transversale]|eukprot:XP_021876681.1 hypothetical protein BCR41DRAFT_193695 [Lobosporangium transversale]